EIARRAAGRRRRPAAGAARGLARARPGRRCVARRRVPGRGARRGDIGLRNGAHPAHAAGGARRSAQHGRHRPPIESSATEDSLRNRQGDGGMSARVALVTGGTGGIGTAICRRLAAGGHRVATNFRNEEKARDWQARMKADGFDIAMARGDVSTPEDAEAMVREVEKQLGPVEILVNNAGITRDGTFHKMSAQQWQEVINTNLNSVFNV